MRIEFSRGPRRIQDREAMPKVEGQKRRVLCCSTEEGLYRGVLL